MSAKSYDVAVIGGGPAGLAAAATAAAGRARVVLIDAAESLGGHFYKVPPPAFAPDKPADPKLKTLQAKTELLARHNVDVLLNTKVWGIFQGAETTFDRAHAAGAVDAAGPFTLHLDPAHAIEARQLIVATGVYDRPIPFPGWTLPGVITPGAAQMLMQKQGLLPGKRVVVAGAGPLQLAVAAALAREGAEVVALLDASPATTGLSLLPGAMWGQWQRLAEFGGYLATLLRHRRPIQFQRAVFRAIGTAERGVEAAVIGRVDAAGQPIPGSEQTIPTDVICSAYGFAPSIAITLHLGCAHDFDPLLAAWAPRHNAAMQTDVPGVLVAGDVTGVGGQPLAELQGELAGLAALEALVSLPAPLAADRREALRPALQREQRFARMIWRRWPIKPGYFKMMDDDTLLCRCEGVTAGDLRQSCQVGAHNLFTAKLRTRLGMGMCQGRYCAANAAMLLAQTTGNPQSDSGAPSIRPPLVPVRLKDIVGEE